MEPRIRFCTSADGTRIAYATLGEGPPLVWVPDWGANLELEWRHPDGHAFVDRLSCGRLYVTYDRRGLGASQREVDDLSLAAHVADVAALVHHLDLEQFDLLGMSMARRLLLPTPHSTLSGCHVSCCGRRIPVGVEIVRPGTIRSLGELIRET
ncbi:hypothetical protein LCGC14_2305470, partial [marine sediment metagenome]